jgi:hypothetical protein
MSIAQPAPSLPFEELKALSLSIEELKALTRRMLRALGT